MDTLHVSKRWCLNDINHHQPIDPLLLPKLPRAHGNSWKSPASCAIIRYKLWVSTSIVHYDKKKNLCHLRRHPSPPRHVLDSLRLNLAGNFYSLYFLKSWSSAFSGKHGNIPQVLSLVSSNFSLLGWKFCRNWTMKHAWNTWPAGICWTLSSRIHRQCASNIVARLYIPRRKVARTPFFSCRRVGLDYATTVSWMWMYSHC